MTDVSEKLKSQGKQRRRTRASGRVQRVETLQDRLEKAMRARGFVPGTKAGLNALARALGKSQGFVSSQLGRTKDPRVSTITMLADKLRVRCDYLLLGIEPMDIEAGPGAETYASLPGWSEAAARARQVMAPYAIDAVARRPVLLRPEPVTVDFVKALAGFWLSWDPIAEEAGRLWIDAQRRGEESTPHK